MKRLLDLLVSVPMLILTAPIVLLCCLLIRLDSPGNAIFSQTRVGQHRRTFTLYKLRTMAKDTGDRASHETGSDKITKIGSFLRWSKLDELPQLYNVVRGDMSLVGPRPCLPVQTELIEAREALGVHAAKPGITGPAALAGIDMSTPQKLAEADANYVRDIGLGSDLKFLFATLFKGKGDAVKR